MPKETGFGGKKVIIIGGGMSGIKIAHTLAKKGVKFLLLETSSIVGGRMMSVRFCGHTLEAGANWAQGIEEKGEGKTNPIWELVKKAGLKGQKSSKEEFIVRSGSNGDDITQQFSDCHEELVLVED